MARILISYRRSDAAAFAGRICDRLVEIYGSEHVFMDVDSIALGDNFVEQIELALAKSDTLLAVIGPEWLTSVDKFGNRRLDDPKDYVRREIAAALRMKIRVVPVLVGGARLPIIEELPEELRELRQRNAFEIGHGSFHVDVERLLVFLEKIATPRTYSVLQAFVLSFYSAALYRDVRRAWRGTGFAYLLFLCALLRFPDSLRTHFKVTEQIEGKIMALASQLPPLTFSNGELSTNIPTPIELRYPDETLTLVIDLTDAPMDTTMLPRGSSLLTRRKLHFYLDNESRWESLTLTDKWVDAPERSFWFPAHLDRARAEWWLNFLKTWGVPLFYYPITVFLWLAYRLVPVALLTLGGLVLRRVFKATLSLRQIMRLAMVAITPFAFLDTGREFLSLEVPLRGLFGIIVATAYLLLAVKSNAARERPALLALKDEQAARRRTDADDAALL
jgi:hypothetical protein